MPDSVLEKVHTLNSLISQVEWSGILLYSVEGTIQNPAEMVITLQDIILMDKGTKSYTEYSFTEKKRDQSGYEDRHIDYTIEKEEALFWSIGHIHSHNTFNVFFSGTDMSELNDNAPSHNIYLSLIVNNALDFTAKIAFVAKAKIQMNTTYTALDQDGEEYIVAPTLLKAEKEKLFIYDCEIISNKDKILSREESFFDRNIREVLGASSLPQFNNTNSFGAPMQKHPQIGVHHNQHQNKNPKPYSNHSPGTLPTTTRTLPKPLPIIEEEEDILPEFPELTVLVASVLMNAGKPLATGLTFDNLLKKIEEDEKAREKVLNEILNILPNVMKEYFDASADQEELLMSYVLPLEEVIEYLELYELAYPFTLTDVIILLKSHVDELLATEEEEEFKN